MEERIQHLAEQDLRHANENPTETEMAFYNHKQGFFLIQECDDGYDYTLQIRDMNCWMEVNLMSRRLQSMKPQKSS